MPLDDSDCFKDSDRLKELEQSHDSCELSDVPKIPERKHEVLEWNACDYVIEEDSVYVIGLDLV
jgi:hypothetical protein